MKSYFEGTCTCIRNLDSCYQIYLCFPNLVYVTKDGSKDL